MECHAIFSNLFPTNYGQTSAFRCHMSKQFRSLVIHNGCSHLEHRNLVNPTASTPSPARLDVFDHSRQRMHLLGFSARKGIWEVSPDRRALSIEGGRFNWLSTATVVCPISALISSSRKVIGHVLPDKFSYSTQALCTDTSSR